MLSECFCQERQRFFRARKISQLRSSCIYTSTEVFEDLPMFFSVFQGQKRLLWVSRKPLSVLALVLFWIAAATLNPRAQGQNAPQQAPANPNQQEAPPEAGGPQNDVG